MRNNFFKKTVLISLLGHLTVFSIFSLSFGTRIPQGEYPNIYFWGQLLEQRQIRNEASGVLPLHSAIFQNRKPDTNGLDKVSKVELMTNPLYLKPQVPLAYAEKKEISVQKAAPSKFFVKEREPVIIFHPVLPYDFNLYFKDRQLAHVELMYKVVPQVSGSVVTVKRKISSGNLEVDLLSSRYINRYLLMQQRSITAAEWRTVKIDLSAKND